jgi:hypothetical protein
VTTFLGVCLLAFAGWIALAIVSTIGRRRLSAMALITLLIAAFAVYVLAASAVQLQHSS